ncbi:MAG: hypothetical protein QOH95_966, partial [Gaiellaceae bacterium]|nr:hypothetical protein [Gaiellaceae bacterium]
MSNPFAAPATMAEAAEAADRKRVARQAAHDRQAELLGPVGRTSLGVLMFVFGGAMLYAVIALWPAIQAAANATATANAAATTAKVTWFGFEWKPSADAALLALVVLSSGVGSYVHAAVSFTDYVGNRGLTVSWIWWYVLRLFVGSSLAVIFYFAIRGGFFSTGGDAAQINPYGIAAISGLVGLFSKQATDKLREIFDTAFRVEQGGDVDRGDSLNTTPGAEAGGPAPGTTIMVATSTAAPSDVDLGAVDQA